MFPDSSTRPRPPLAKGKLGRGFKHTLPNHQGLHLQKKASLSIPYVGADGNNRDTARAFPLTRFREGPSSPLRVVAPAGPGPFDSNFAPKGSGESVRKLQCGVPLCRRPGGAQKRLHPLFDQLDLHADVIPFLGTSSSLKDAGSKGDEMVWISWAGASWMRASLPLKRRLHAVTTLPGR